MDMFEKRRRLLMSLTKKFMIFLNELLVGEVIKSEHSEISSGYINIKWGQEPGRASKKYPGDYTYNGKTGEAAIRAEAEDSGYQNIRIYPNGDGYILEWDITRREGGYLTIGSYDFTKYKKLKFTVEGYGIETYDIENYDVEDYSVGESIGYVEFGDTVESITDNGIYSVSIKNYEGLFDITFRSDPGVKYSVNNVYLAG